MADLFVGLRCESRKLDRVLATLQEVEELLMAGVLPSAAQWKGIEGLPAPWGYLASDSIRQLRGQGAAVLPTLRRLRALAGIHREALVRARARGAQGLAQATVAAFLVPIFGAVLHLLIPGVAERPWTWLLGCTLALSLALLGGVWMLALSDSARWAGLSHSERPWVLAVQCAAERFLALVRCGNPADQAWTQAVDFLRQDAAPVALVWGASVWMDAAGEGHEVRSWGSAAGREVRQLLFGLGVALRSAVQVSVLEGRPCGDRVETALRGFQTDFEARVEKELTLLGTRILKPLFIFVAPALLGLLGFGMWLAWLEVSRGIN